MLCLETKALLFPQFMIKMFIDISFWQTFKCLKRRKQMLFYEWFVICLMIRIGSK